MMMHGLANFKFLINVRGDQVVLKQLLRLLPYVRIIGFIPYVLGLFSFSPPEKNFECIKLINKTNNYSLVL